MPLSKIFQAHDFDVTNVDLSTDKKVKEAANKYCHLVTILRAKTKQLHKVYEGEFYAAETYRTQAHLDGLETAFVSYRNASNALSDACSVCAMMLHMGHDLAGTVTEADMEKESSTALADRIRVQKEYNQLFHELSNELRTPAPAPVPPAPAAPVQAPPQNPPDNDGQPKLNYKVKEPPYKLSVKHTPMDKQIWYQHYRHYYQTNGLQRLEPRDQRTHLMTCLDQNLWLQLQAHTTDDMPSCGDDDNVRTCFDVINEIFNREWLRNDRQAYFFNLKAETNERLDCFRTRRTAAKNAAEIYDTDTIAKLEVAMFLGAIRKSHENVFQECLKEDEATLTIEKICQLDYRLNPSNTGPIPTPKQMVANKTAYQKGKQGGNQKPNPQKNTSEMSLDEMKKAGLCLGCGSPRHKKGPDCKHNEATCNNCGRKGHIANVCKSKKSDAKPKKGGSAPKNQSSHTSKRTEHFARMASSFTPPSLDPRVPVEFTPAHGKPFTFNALPDTGTTTTIFGHDVAVANGIPFRNTDCSGHTLRDASGNLMDISGIVEVEAKFENRRETIDVLVSRSVKGDILVGCMDVVNLGLLLPLLLQAQHLSEDQRAQVKNAYQSFVNKVEAIKHAESIEERVLKLKEKYKAILSDELSKEPMAGPPMKIHLKKGPITPFKVCKSMKPPSLHLLKATDKALQQMIDDDVIEEVDKDAVIEWCAISFPVPKPNSEDVRIVTDFSHLNKFVERPVHPFIAGTDLLKQISHTSKVFAKLDAVRGYHQIPIHKDYRRLLCFLTHKGRFWYKRGPMGLNATGDEWCARSDAAIAGIEGVIKLVDDILIEAPDYDVLFERLDMVLARCLENNITISLRKLEVGEQVTFAGFHVSANGVKPTEARVQGISEFPKPKCLQDMRSFLGLTNTLANFRNDLSMIQSPLRELTKPKVAWNWLPEQEEAFATVKKVLTSDLVVKHYNPELPVELITDASRVGFGYALVNRETSGAIALINCGSRALTDAESRYSVIDLEATAILFAVKKCFHYLFGHPGFKVITDHKPLLGIFSKNLSEIENARLRRVREKLSEYSFQVEWLPGATNQIADALSRAPVSPADPSLEFVCRHTNLTDEDDPSLRPLLEAARDDEFYQQVIEAFRKGHTAKTLKNLPPNHPARTYASVWDDLSLEETGLLVYASSRIVIPGKFRSTLLDILHLSHCGISKTQDHARQLYFWPGMNREIQQRVENCEKCRTLLPSQPQEPVRFTFADAPMEAVGVDLFQVEDRHYVIMVCRYSSYPFVAPLRKLDTKAVLDILQNWFYDFGLPKYLRSDGGPQFRSEFDSFCQEKGIIHEKSSPHYPQSNGLAEAGVKQMKHLLLKCDTNWSQFKMAMFHWRNITNESGASPALMFFGRRQRTLLPMHPSLAAYQPEEGIHGARTRREIREAAAGVGTALPRLNKGASVVLQDPQSRRWTTKAKVIRERGHGRSYEVRAENGKTFTRNRRLIRQIPEIEATENSGDSTATPMEISAPPRRSGRISGRKDKGSGACAVCPGCQSSPNT